MDAVNTDSAGYDISAGVAMRFTTWTLSDAGQPRITIHVQRALRGALLIDLALANAITLTNKGLVAIAQTNRLRSANMLLAEIAKRPDRSINDWMVKGNLS